jgi:hypothetical protein
MSRVAVICLVAALSAVAMIVWWAASSAPVRRHPDAGAPAQARAAPARARRALRFRYIYNSGPAQRVAARHGWNLLDVGSLAAADNLPKGTRGLVWVGDYDNSSCQWEVSDSALKGEIKPGDPKVAGYFFSDEPDPRSCPDAPAQHRTRARLIKRLDPGKLTVMVMDSNSGRASLDQIPLWVGVADYVGLDPYPCYQGRPCRYSWIRTIITAADRARLRYWGVAQAFDDPPWRWPTAAEETRMLSQWASSRASGYMTFAWTWAGRTLGERAGLLGALTRFNRGRPASATVESAPAREVHYTITGPRSVAFAWVGGGGSIRYGRTRRYGTSARAHPPRPLPFSSPGPFREARLGDLKPASTYHYSIGRGPDHTFSTTPRAPFTFDVEADVGDSGSFDGVRPTQHQIAGDRPAFVLVPGDLTYANDDGQRAVDRHFNDVMAWSQTAAYMPAWGNHEWDEQSDDLRNYKGRFAIPHPHGSPGAPGRNCCGEDWGWFDAGGVRFISYPEPYSDATWRAWRSQADRVMAAAQSDRRINFIVTFGHRPAYSSGYHEGDSSLAAILNSFGDRYSKYVLNLNGHSHDYERFEPIHHVVHVTAGGGGAELEPWSRSDPRTAFRALHLEHLRLAVGPTRIRLQAVCGPPSSEDDYKCRQGNVIDSYTITK